MNNEIKIVRFNFMKEYQGFHLFLYGKLYNLIAILRRQFFIIMTASWKQIYSVLGGVPNFLPFSVVCHHLAVQMLWTRGNLFFLLPQKKKIENKH